MAHHGLRLSDKTVPASGTSPDVTRLLLQVTGDLGEVWHADNDSR